MKGRAELAGLLLAAGRAQRFGGGKLEVDFRGKSLGLHAAAGLARIVGDGECVAVASPGTSRLRSGLDDLGYRVIENGNPDLGLSHSIRLAMATIFSGGARGVMIALADMPCVPDAHLNVMTQLFVARGRTMIITSGTGSMRSPPVIIPRRFWAHLIALDGDRGARELLRQGVLVAADARWLSDIDYRNDLETVSSTID